MIGPEVFDWNLPQFLSPSCLMSFLLFVEAIGKDNSTIFNKAAHLSALLRWYCYDEEVNKSVAYSSLK